MEKISESGWLKTFLKGLIYRCSFEKEKYEKTYRGFYYE